MMLEGAFTCSPQKFYAKDAVERSSLLLLDKDLCETDDESENRIMNLLGTGGISMHGYYIQ